MLCKHKYINNIMLGALACLMAFGAGCSGHDPVAPDFAQPIDPNRITAMAPFNGAFVVFKGDGRQFIQYVNGVWSDPIPTADIQLPFDAVGAMGWYNGSAMMVNLAGTLFSTYTGSRWTAATDVTTLTGYPLTTIGAIGSYHGKVYFYDITGQHVTIFAGGKFSAPALTDSQNGTVGAMGGLFRGRVVFVDASGMNFKTRLDNPDNIYWTAGSGPVTELNDLAPIIGFKVENFYVWRSCDIDGTGEFDYDISVKPRSWGPYLVHVTGSVSSQSETSHWINKDYKLIPYSGKVDVKFWCRENDPLGADLFMNGKTESRVHTVTTSGTITNATSGQRIKLKISGTNCQAEAWYTVTVYR